MPESQRSDGSWRKSYKIKEGYIPPHMISSYVPPKKREDDEEIEEDIYEYFLMNDRLAADAAKKNFENCELPKDFGEIKRPGVESYSKSIIFELKS